MLALGERAKYLVGPFFSLLPLPVETYESEEQGMMDRNEHCTHTRTNAQTPNQMSLEADFQAAAERVRAAMSTPGKADSFSTEDKTRIYSLYKQATNGDVTGDQPWAVQFEARAKYDGWAACKGMSKDAAMTEYISFTKAKLG